MTTEFDHKKIDKRVRWEVLEFEKFWHSECAEPTIKRMKEISPPIARARIFLGQWRPKKRFELVVDRCGYDAPYLVDWYYEEHKTNAKAYPVGWNFTNITDRLGSKWFRFYRAFLDRSVW